MTRSGLTTIPTVRPPFRRDRRFAPDVFSRACWRVRGIMRGSAARRDRAERLESPHISRYVDASEEEDRTNVAEAVWKLRELEQERAAAEATMNRYLAELVFDA